ncbi:MAG: DUF2249 domain-containing protein [Rubrivivax sp.]|nr:MAG: DUF2249 domain-containing protein [Rubrivivax sp.]
MSPQAALDNVLDLRTVAPQERHPLIFSAFRALTTSGALELVNDHDPRPLRAQFDAQQPGRFSWEAIESGPATWRVRITRTGGGHASGQCCGSCGGA